MSWGLFEIWNTRSMRYNRYIESLYQVEDDAKVFRVFLGGEDVITATAVPCSERLKTLGIPLPDQGYTENA